MSKNTEIKLVGQPILSQLLQFRFNKVPHRYAVQEGDATVIHIAS